MDNRRRPRPHPEPGRLAAAYRGKDFAELVEFRRRVAVAALVLALALFTGIFWWSAAHRPTRLAARESIAAGSSALRAPHVVDPAAPIHAAQSAVPVLLGASVRGAALPHFIEAQVAGQDVLLSDTPSALRQAAGLVVLLHGCAQSKDSFRYLSRYRSVVAALQRTGMFTVALSAHERDAAGGGFAGSGCWDTRTEVDVVRVAAVLHSLLIAGAGDAGSGGSLVPRIPATSLAAAGLTQQDVGQCGAEAPCSGTPGQHEHAPTQLPIFALGASSGGGFAALLTTRLRLAGAVVYIMGLPRDLVDMSSAGNEEGGGLGPALQPGGHGLLRPDWVSGRAASPTWLAAVEAVRGGGDAVAAGGFPADMGVLLEPRVLPPLLMLPMIRDAGLMRAVLEGLAVLRSEAGVDVVAGGTGSGGGPGGDGGAGAGGASANPPDKGSAFGLSAAALAAEVLVGVALEASLPPLRALPRQAALAAAAGATAGVSGASAPSATPPAPRGVSVLPLTPRPLCPWTLHAALPWSVAPVASAALFQLLVDRGVLRLGGADKAAAVRSSRGGSTGGLRPALAAVAALITKEKAAMATEAAAAASAPVAGASGSVRGLLQAEKVEGGAGAGGSEPLGRLAALHASGRAASTAAEASSVAFTLNAWPPVGMTAASSALAEAGEGGQAGRQAGEGGQAERRDRGHLGLSLLQIDPSTSLAEACGELIANSRSVDVAAVVDAWLAALSPRASPPPPLALQQQDEGEPRGGPHPAAAAGPLLLSPQRLPLPRPLTGQAALDAAYWDVALAAPVLPPPPAVRQQPLPPAPPAILVLVPQANSDWGGGSGSAPGAPEAAPPATATADLCLRVLRKAVSEVLSDAEAIHEMSGQHAEAVAAWVAAVARS